MLGRIHRECVAQRRGEPPLTELRPHKNDDQKDRGREWIRPPMTDMVTRGPIWATYGSL
jgi:hypothetical protein